MEVAWPSRLSGTPLFRTRPALKSIFTVFLLGKAAYGAGDVFGADPWSWRMSKQSALIKRLSGFYFWFLCNSLYIVTYDPGTIGSCDSFQNFLKELENNFQRVCTKLGVKKFFNVLILIFSFPLFLVFTLWDTWHQIIVFLVFNVIDIPGWL